MLDANVFQKAREALSPMKNPVKLLLFRSASHESGEMMEQLIRELSNANPLLSIGVLDFDSQSPEAAQYGVKNPSTLCIIGKEKRSIRMLGMPSGMEFMPFLKTIVDVSRGEADLARGLQDTIMSIDFEVNLKVFVTPSCPHCPGVARLAHIMALLNPKVSSEVIESMEFPGLSQHYKVGGVPKMVINEAKEVVGGYPPEVILKRILDSRP
ncbi:MAG: thioredoxin family protein [Candidatus ainarchaeum sp.]|nr:thioredoxin family protein [Candidatus ainarchaeum sp.]